MGNKLRETVLDLGIDKIQRHTFFVPIPLNPSAATNETAWNRGSFSSNG